MASAAVRHRRVNEVRPGFDEAAAAGVGELFSAVDATSVTDGAVTDTRRKGSRRRVHPLTVVGFSG